MGECEQMACLCAKLEKPWFLAFATCGLFIVFTTAGYLLMVDAVNHESLADVRAGMTNEAVEGIFGQPPNRIERVERELCAVDSLGELRMTYVAKSRYWEGSAMTVRVDFARDDTVVQAGPDGIRETMRSRIRRWFGLDQRPTYVEPTSSNEVLPD